tara:strand:+ start:550 stop:993 length:444 start_codon:yes stop_codon:yes gene_type:complete
MDFEKLITLTVEENEQHKSELMKVLREASCSECSEPAMADTHPTKKGEACCDVCWDSVDPPDEEVCSDCGKSEEELDANDVEIIGEGKYARCLDCEDERFSHMEDACDECGDRVGRHAANVGTIGMKICFDCDSSGAYAKATEENEK